MNDSNATALSNDTNADDILITQLRRQTDQLLLHRVLAVGNPQTPSHAHNIFAWGTLLLLEGLTCIL